MIVGAQPSRPHSPSPSRSRLASAFDAAERWWGRGPAPGVGRCAGATPVVHGDSDVAIRLEGRAKVAGVWGASIVHPGMGHELPRVLWFRFAGDVRATADAARS
jgi:hypothetical protein